MKEILNCVCGEKPIAETYTCGMGDFSYRIYCPKCKKQVDYTMYVKNYEDIAMKEWNKFTRFETNALRDYCNDLVRIGCSFTKEELSLLLKLKFDISMEEANIYVEEYIEGLIFQINCEFFAHRYTGMFAKDYMPIVQEKFNLSDEVVKIYHESFLEHMPETNGRFLEEGIDYQNNKKKTLKILFKNPKNK